MLRAARSGTKNNTNQYTEEADMQPKNYDYRKFRPIDVLCTSARSPEARLIRLYTARLKGRSGIVEMFRRRIANHCAIVVAMGGRFWLAEMCPDGLKINSMRKYLNNRRERIAAVKRLRYLTETDRRSLNSWLLDSAHETVKYDYSMIREYIGLGQDNPKRYYCSELCEIAANRVGRTWDAFQLKRPRRGKTLIAPVEVHFGDPERTESVDGWYTY
jgi:hypothetical protein